MNTFLRLSRRVNLPTQSLVTLSVNRKFFTGYPRRFGRWHGPQIRRWRCWVAKIDGIKSVTKLCGEQAAMPAEDDEIVEADVGAEDGTELGDTSEVEFRRVRHRSADVLANESRQNARRRVR